ncbi:DNA helicase RecQ [Lewinella sp. 4G2]|uniref:DNA helicase RecQ n=1 Tax=Lewinella sp. 4G2 TaxID=1803372 RepID=UPI0007B4D867|nr:DNA helicase RecQ [Lewinella sp. 4G2]
MTPELARTALKKYFGYDGFRPLQLDIINKVYQGEDGIVLMPTGGGKSICFQIPAVTMNGTVVVVSPLISLMKDQVDGLTAVGIRAAYLNSSQSSADAHGVEVAYENGELHLLYVSPEKLLSPGFFQFLKRRKVCLFAIDEAHCISAWGHDFRPEYTQLKSIKASFPEVPILALTATADRLTRRDMAEQLGIPNAEQHIASFNRPNLSLAVRPGKQRRQQIVQFLRHRPDTAGIVYCLSRKQTENLAEKLREAGYNAEAYHAGLSPQKRADVQSDFINDRTLIICATVAFGMGIDKSNVRWVIHYSLPKNLENYYQEIGRAGRDGAPADTLLFYSYNDYMTLKDMLGGNQNSELQLAKLDRMKEYADSLACRRRILLNYFSEDHSEDCGNCDICANPPERFDGTVLAQKALSAVTRLRENVGINMTIDVLRGSNRSDLKHNGYDRIKTYGAGRDVTSFDWAQYFNQLISLGYLYVAHEDYNKVKLAPGAKRVLYEGEAVELVKMTTIKERRAKEAANAPKRQRGGVITAENADLFERLRTLRKEIAREKGLPPYVIFHDSTLQEMATFLPASRMEMSRISGVGEAKMTNYGQAFIDAIAGSPEYAKAKAEGTLRPQSQATMDFSGKSASTSSSSTKPTDDTPEDPAKAAKRAARLRDKERIGSTPSHIYSLQAFRSGETPADIAARREMTKGTIVTHLVRCYLAGEEVDIESLLPPFAEDRIREARTANPEAEGTGPIVAWLNDKYGNGTIGYDAVRIVDALAERATQN